MTKKLLISLFASLGLSFLSLASNAELGTQAEMEKHNFDSKLSPPASQVHQTKDKNNGNASNPFLCGACHRDSEAEPKTGSL